MKKKEFVLVFDSVELITRLIVSILTTILIYLFSRYSLRQVIDVGIILIVLTTSIAAAEIIKRFYLSKRLTDHLRFTEEAKKIILEYSKSNLIKDDEYLNKVCLSINPYKLTYNWKEFLIYSGTQFLLLNMVLGFVGKGTFGQVVVLSFLTTFYCVISLLIVNLSLFIYSFKINVNSMIIRENDVINKEVISKLSKLEGFKAIEIKVKEID